MNFLTSASYNEIRVTLKKNYKILHVLGDLNNSFFLGTAIETCVLFLQKKKSKSNKFVVTFGSSLIFSVYFKRLNQLLSEGQSLKNLGFTITMGSFLKSNKFKLVNGVRGYLICDSNINQDNFIKHFFQGAFAYHIHMRKTKQIVENSYFELLEKLKFHLLKNF